MTWLCFGGQWSMSEQAVEVAKASTSTLGVRVHLVVLIMRSNL